MVQYIGESKHCADQEAVKLTCVRAVKGSKSDKIRGEVTLHPAPVSPC